MRVNGVHSINMGKWGKKSFISKLFEKRHCRCLPSHHCEKCVKWIL